MSLISSPRCAIYTRKSSDERLDAEYSSLDNQRAYCAAYIKSHGGQGWIELDKRYDDGGFSGGSLQRPALAELRADIEAGRVDVVVVYKIDRLSRSLRDFANLIAEFDARGVTFVSVTQSFDTSTAMGRLTLNVLLSFAQFERELTGERLKDWFAGARARGLWCGPRPYGYRKQDNHLVIDPAEAAIVRHIFARYPTLGSCRLVADELMAMGALNTYGRPIQGHIVGHMIKSRVYRGEMVHKHVFFPGIHEPIVSEAAWRRANKVYAESRWRKRALVAQPVEAMLKGLLYDRTGHRMHHTFMHSKGRLYRYYVAGSERYRYGPNADVYTRFRATDLEAAIVGLLARLTGSATDRSRREMIQYVRHLVARIDVQPEALRVTLRTGAELTCEPAGRLGPRRRMITARGARMRVP